MTKRRITVGGFQVAEAFFNFINHDVIPGTGIEQDKFWQLFEAIVNELSPINKQLLDTRVKLQSQIDEWHKQHQTSKYDEVAYKAFLQKIGYLVPDVADFKISPKNVDPEVANLAGPQLVVPVMNARYALNATNARWGSLYDALYSTDVIEINEETAITKGYNPKRGDAVVAYAKQYLDETFALKQGTFSEVSNYQVVNEQLQITLINGETTQLLDTLKFVGFKGNKDSPSAILLVNNGLHAELVFNANDSVGEADIANMSDVIIESAVTVIHDCEDSIAAVDVDDKIQVYKNWLGLMKGDLSEKVTKGDKVIHRSLNTDRYYTAKNGKELTLSARSLMFVRNVGHLMTNESIICKDGSEIPEGILDGVVTSLIAIHDLKHTGALVNSSAGSIYIVKPKMHGPEEVTFAVKLFGLIEDAFGLEANTIKMGLMDEERRTSVNLKQCIYAAKERVVFINTGFMDRTGDEIHTCMEAGPVVPKEAMKSQDWIQAYESRNVVIGLNCGFKGKGQIGKGMWPIPDNMAQMLVEKDVHPKAGANCAWVPSPTAATLHALHYHKVNVAARQDGIVDKGLKSIDMLLTLPLLKDQSLLTAESIQLELDNNIQGILGYVVRWVNMGIGCSKVPNIEDVGLMEDRATLRISSQHVANWLHHGICTNEQVENTLVRMAKVVDQQNSQDKNYIAMSANLNTSDAFSAAYELVFKGSVQPSGYTEPVLHRQRLIVKSK
ncbi:malate synthase G [Pseudoalteromonas sp. NBT06-2]|uniref:malate synthase G n=1 Tax=Pseudoalteromonas sp. NBT06-2 TaxID=2025950 RepID=UPI000BA7B96B|nr:malate synthase G [Pseudoalteromonas sp. NBT06-2]PAJ75033.1 malate synthase G [Pseudoalteromonas sp. NBT06-2]